MNVEHPTPNAKITANGKSETIALPCSLTQYLASKGLDPRQVAVERNGTVVFKSEYAATQLQEGDRLEIIKIVAGG